MVVEDEDLELLVEGMEVALANMLGIDLSKLEEGHIPRSPPLISVF